MPRGSMFISYRPTIGSIGNMEIYPYGQGTRGAFPVLQTWQDFKQKLPEGQDGMLIMSGPQSRSHQRCLLGLIWVNLLVISTVVLLLETSLQQDQLHSTNSYLNTGRPGPTYTYNAPSVTPGITAEGDE